MDPRFLDHLALALAAEPDAPGAISARRRLLALGALVAAPIAALLAPAAGEDAEAKDRRRRRKQRHNKRKSHGNRQRGCKAKSAGKVCAGQCGVIKNRSTCGKSVDCGPCACNPACDACSTCDTATNTCTTQCPADRTCCDASCINLTANNTNCGACGHVCPAESFCVAAVCTTCDPVCTGNDVCCGDLICHDLQDDPHHCGECGHFCGDDSICVAGACHACDVTCGGTPADCGLALNTAFSSGSGTLYVCPGTYAGSFSIGGNLEVIGAGAGDDPATATILDGEDTQRVLYLPMGSRATVSLERLHITRGRVEAVFGAGIYNDYDAADLTLRACAVTNCYAENGTGLASGGAIFANSPLTLIDSRITGNTCANSAGAIYTDNTVTLRGTTEISGNTAFRGGGIYCNAATLDIGADVRITMNSAASGNGGGIYNNSCTITIAGADPSPTIVANCHENCAGNAVAKCAAGGTCPP